MDLLQQCAKEFDHLIPYQYHIIIGRKGKILNFTISFDRADFHHLAGLHKLKDNVRFQTGKRSDILKEILVGHLTFSHAQQSAFFDEMKMRLLQNNFRGTPVYLFLSQRTNGNTQVCRTFFPKTAKDYAQGQPRYTLLRKEKQNLFTNETTIQYDRLTSKG